MTVAVQTWRKATLGDLAAYINGRAFKPSDWGTSGRAIIRIQNLTDPAAPAHYYDGPVDSRHVIHKGDLLISWSPTLGAYIWAGQESLLNQHIFRVDVRDGLVDKSFLYYLVLHKLSDMADRTHGLTMKHITKSRFESIEVRIPDLNEQRRIAHRIGQLMTLVDEAECAQGEAACEIAAIPSSLRFDLWNNVRHRYPCVQLGDITEVAKNGLYKPSKFHGSGVVLVRMFNINGGHFATDRLERIQVSPEEKSAYGLRVGDLLVSRVNSRELVGKSCCFDGLAEDAVFEAMVIRLRLRMTEADPRFIASLMNSPQFLDELRSRAKHAIGQSSINQHDLLTMRLPLPPLEAQRNVGQRLLKAEDLVPLLTESQAQKSDEMRALRESILRKAFSGEL